MDNKSFKQLYSSISEKELSLFINYLSKRSGILITPEKAYMFETRLSKMMADVGIDSFGEFYEYIMSGKDPLAPQKIINAMVTNETLWFRDVSPWKVMEERLLPKLVDQLLTGKKERVRIWSAAASTGQEIYSIVMCVADYLERNQIKGVTLSHFDFLATDISSRVLDIAKKGRYDSISIMRGLNEYYRSKYFVKDNAAWNLDPKIRNAVTFINFNLLNSYLGFGTFDIIFCRYVLIYFSDELKHRIMRKMWDALTDSGVLFTGNYALIDLFEDNFTANDYGNLTYYTKRR